jgi:hypothetical protein
MTASEDVTLSEAKGLPSHALAEAVGGLVRPPIPWPIRKKSYVSHRLLAYQAPAPKAINPVTAAMMMGLRGRLSFSFSVSLRLVDTVTPRNYAGNAKDADGSEL